MVHKIVNLYPLLAFFLKWQPVSLLFALGPRIHWRLQNQQKDRSYKQGCLH